MFAFISFLLYLRPSDERLCLLWSEHFLVLLFAVFDFVVVVVVVLSFFWTCSTFGFSGERFQRDEQNDGVTRAEQRNIMYAQIVTERTAVNAGHKESRMTARQIRFLQLFSRCWHFVLSHFHLLLGQTEGGWREGGKLEHKKNIGEGKGR